MAKIRDILSIHLDDDIKSVIDLNQQDENSIKDELNNFILTESLAAHLSDFCDFFLSNTAQPGLWLSGFYGSGKSYFSKMIGFLLRNPDIDGIPFRRKFESKLIGLEDSAILKNSIDALSKTNNHVVLFDAAKATGNHGLSYMMMGTFLRSLGLNDDWVGLIEFDLLVNDQYEAFCKKVQDKFGEPWEKRRMSMLQVLPTLEQTLLDGFCTKEGFEETKEFAKSRIQYYSAESLIRDLNLYFEKNPDTRVVFMIDEVSEAIAQGKINVLDLEGVAEAMASLNNKVWTIAIAQLQLDDVINTMNVNRSLLTKIIDRFRKRINIEAQEVDTIIRKRLLAKNTQGEELLCDYFNKHSGRISDITNLTGTGLQQTTDAKTYADYYPFYEHQFKLLQYFLFGSQTLVKTQVGTRGMLISAFDVLKKEALSDRELFAHVNASQLCRQAEEAVPVSLQVRYGQADDHLRDMKLTRVSGHELLQTIHFLAEANAKTTVENICRAYVNCPEDYYAVLEEIKKVCEKLVGEKVLVLSGDEYRITSETQQRIFEMMNGYDGIASFNIKSEITKHVKNMKMVRDAQSVAIDSSSRSFYVGAENGECFANSGEQSLRVILHDVMNVGADFDGYVNRIKEETQNEKGRISIVPSNDSLEKIQSVAEEILRIDYIRSVPNLTAEEKKVVEEIAGTLQDKNEQLDRLVRNAYENGTLVYQYNTFRLTEREYAQALKETELKMYNNVYTRRIHGVLKDSLAAQLLKAKEKDLQGILGTEDDFIFFDTTGRFIGENKPVVSEIMRLISAFKNGNSLESELTAPPTGYTYGTIVSTLAALFRASKVIVKYNGRDYTSWSVEGASEPFKTSRAFAQASFKAVADSLSYNERKKIVDELKDCDIKTLTGKSVAYTMNDFELVDAIRTLALKETSKVEDFICKDAEISQLFKKSKSAKDGILEQFTGAVTENTYLQTAKKFIELIDSKAFIDAVDQIEKDVQFVQKELKNVQKQQKFLEDVKNELELSEEDTHVFDGYCSAYEEALSGDVVKNYTKLKTEYNNVKLLYESLMVKKFKDLKELYSAALNNVELVKKELDNYDHSWNEQVYSELNRLEQICKKYVVDKPVLREFETRCSNSNLQLHDADSAIKMQKQTLVSIEVAKTEINTTAPNTVVGKTTEPSLDAPTSPSSIPAKQDVQPKERKLKAQLPSGKMSVSDYKKWLTSQLSMLSKFEATDILRFDI